MLFRIMIAQQGKLIGKLYGVFVRPAPRVFHEQKIPEHLIIETGY